MCLAIPGKVISTDLSDPEMKMAKVKFGEIIKDICIQWVDEVEVGDYVIAHIGTALSKVDEADAKYTLDALKEMGNIDYNSES